MTVDLKHTLEMTGCATAEELIDMAKVGLSLMNAIDTFIKPPSLIEGWSPADDPAEIVGDLYNMFEESIACHKADLERLRAAEETLAAIGQAVEAKVRKAGQVAVDELVERMDGKHPGNDDLADYMGRIIDACVVAARPVGTLPYQKRVGHWMHACFGNDIPYDKAERNYRFLEEALELAQACGATAHDAHTLVDYVFGRPVGDPRQEVGGVEVTLAALCSAHAIDLDAAREAELTRVWSKVEQIRAKHESKPKGIRSPLPGGANG